MTQGPSGGGMSGEASSTGLDPKLGGLLCYLLGIVTGIVFLIIEKENRTIRFHAFQSLATFGFLIVLSIAFAMIPFLRWLQIPLNLASLVLWIVLMVKAFQGQRFKLPVVGDWAEEQAGLRSR